MFGKIGKAGYAATPPAPVPLYEPACMVEKEVEYTVNNMSEKTFSLHRCVLPFYSDCAMLLHKALLMLLLCTVNKKYPSSKEIISKSNSRQLFPPKVQTLCLDFELQNHLIS